MANTAADLLSAAKDWKDTLRTLYTDAIALGVRVTSWAKGSPTRAIYYSVARAQADLSSKIQAIANQGFRSTAKGDALTLNIREVFGIKRPGATYATTTILISNSSGGNYPFKPRSLILLNTSRKKQYVNTGQILFEPLASNVPVSIIAMEPGSDSAALPNEIDAFVTPVEGLTISQPNAALAEDAMSDADLNAAADARVGFMPTASTIGAGGAPGAYESVVRTGPDGQGGVRRDDGTLIAVTRVRVIDDGSGGVEVVVADEDGPLAVDDLAYLDKAVKAYALPTGTFGAVVTNASAINYSFTYTAYIPASSSALDPDCKAAGDAAITAYLKGVPIGGYELTSGSFSIPLGGIRRAMGNAIAALAGGSVDVVITTPSSSPVILNPKAVPVLSGTPSGTIARVPGV